MLYGLCFGSLFTMKTKHQARSAASRSVAREKRVSISRSVPQGAQVKVVFWSKSGDSRTHAALKRRAKKFSQGSPLPLEAKGHFYAARLNAPVAGTLVLQLWSPRPLRLWVGGVLVADEGIYWRSFQREVRAAVVVPCVAGDNECIIEMATRPVHLAWIDEHCPSRNRVHVMQGLLKAKPDVLRLAAQVFSGVELPALALRFLPSQFVKDGITYQHLLMRRFDGFFTAPPVTHVWSPVEALPPWPCLSSGGKNPKVQDGTRPEEREQGLRRMHVPVLAAGESLPPLRAVGIDDRLEPESVVAGTVPLTMTGSKGSVVIPMPIHEGLGRLAPKREFKDIEWPAFENSRSLLPEPIVPADQAWLKELYYAAWQMLFSLVRHPSHDSGLPGPYICTGMGFKLHQFVWDTSFTAMATAYGHRAMPAYASMDLLYSRQFDGGYLHREHDIRDGLPALFEPDFSPSAPLMSVAEWANFKITADVERLRAVYPSLKANHLWLWHNRRLPDGTFWTTGLANGLDNSPSMGDGYPCLTSQMAHEAETLAAIAQVLGIRKDQSAWQTEYAATARALNRHLWSERMQIYASSLPGGGHNPNKVVTAFWPLWAGVVPPQRVEALARHLTDPASFWRHHPIPSLAADSPLFQPSGNYWLGSTWAPTNVAAIQGFDRAGRHDLAVATTLKHLRCMYDVFKDTKKLWENYCSEHSRRGNWSNEDYCWTATSPVALMLEVVMGIRADAPHGRIAWRLPDWETAGLRNLQFGEGTVSLVWKRRKNGRGIIETESDRALTVSLHTATEVRVVAIRPGNHRTPVSFSPESFSSLQTLLK